MKTAILTRKKSAIILSYIPLTFGIFFIGFMLLRFPETASQGISDGVDLSLGILIPSLYPFMVLSSLIIELGVMRSVPDIIDTVTQKLFRLSGKSLGIFLISLIGGLPLGCKMTSELYDKGEISRSEGQRMMLFCYCCGPAFTISSVGLYMLGSKQAGAVIYLSTVLSAVTVGILSRFFGTEDYHKKDLKSTVEPQAFSVSLVRSVSSGSTAMLSVCAWVILFSCINRLIEILPVSDSLKLFFYATSEVTNGVYISAGTLSLPIIAGVTAFGGLCGHCQVMPYIIKLRLSYKHFLTSRIICGAISVIYCELLLKIIPVTYEVFSIGTPPTKIIPGISAGLSISMLITAGLFLLGDSAIFRIKTKKDHRF